MTSPTQARVHLGNIHANLVGVRDRVGRDRRILFAVKANAYGHGAVPVSKMVQDTSVADMLGVATVSEAQELRAAGITLPVLKLSPAMHTELVPALEAGIAFTVADASHIVALQGTCVTMGVRADVHLKVDVGMGRVGCTPDEAAPLAELVVKKCPNLRLAGIFTHLPTADDPAFDNATDRQLAVFSRVVGEVTAAIGREIEMVHAANSAGILAHPGSWFSMVRPGIMGYGYLPGPDTPATVRLAPGLSWSSRVSYLKRVTRGTPIGYGSTWHAEDDTWIATIPVGYGDGYSRLLSNRGRVLIAGASYPVVGRVCMDQIMVNLGADANVSVGQEVVLIGASGAARIGADDLGETIGTIPYEVTTLIAPRVPRIYSAVPAAAQRVGRSSTTEDGDSGSAGASAEGDEPADDLSLVTAFS